MFKRFIEWIKFLWDIKNKMATQNSVWIPDVSVNIGNALLAPSGDSGNIFIGKRRLFRIWTDNPSGMSIGFGMTTVTLPTSSSYSIGNVPQDFDTGDVCDTIRLVNNSGTSVAHYFIQALSKF